MRFNMKPIYLIFLSLVYSVSNAQHYYKSFRSSINYGSIFKHSSAFDSVGKLNPSLFLEAGIEFTPNKLQNFHHFYKKPTFSANIIYLNNGNKVLGQGFGFYFGVNFPLLRKGKHELFGSLGSGAIALTKKYDSITNPQNTVIASTINDFTTGHLLYKYHINPSWAISFKSSITHVSNGAWKRPNKGINSSFLGIGVTYNLQKRSLLTKETFNVIKFPKFKNRFFAGAETRITRAQHKAFPNKNYPAYGFNVKGYFMAARYFGIVAGLDAEYNKYVLASAKANNQNTAFGNVLRTSWFLGYELFIGHYSFKMARGHYFHDIANYKPNYVFASAQYYFKSTNLSFKHQFYINATLKVHKGTAEYPALGFGFNF
jgi:hypothetical protein